MPSSLYPTVQASVRPNATPPTGSRAGVVVAPPLVHIPEEACRPPPVSPKSAKTRAKWLSLTEGEQRPAKEPGAGPIAVSTPRVPSSLPPSSLPPSTLPSQPPGQPRVMQVYCKLQSRSMSGCHAVSLFHFNWHSSCVAKEIFDWRAGVQTPHLSANFAVLMTNLAHL